MDNWADTLIGVLVAAGISKQMMAVAAVALAVGLVLYALHVAWGLVKMFITTGSDRSYGFSSEDNAWSELDGSDYSS